MDISISSEWTDSERLWVVQKISEELRERSALRPNKLFEFSERLNFLATASASFLEANRNQIIGK
jgi:CRISPR/Cas system-associated protein Csx1